MAATTGPGLIGSLLVGVGAAKACRWPGACPSSESTIWRRHLFAALLEHPDLGWPLVVLLVSGGHTLLVEMPAPGRYRLLGQTIDDAAGEAFDKVARFLGLGYPGGPAIDRAAEQGDPGAFAFPRALRRRRLRLLLQRAEDVGGQHRPQAARRPPTEDVAASFQQAVVDVLVAKARRAAADVGARAVCLAGGVAANSLLRRRIAEAAPTTASGRSSPAERCAPTTPPWWPRQAGGSCGRRPEALDVGADPSLGLARSPSGPGPPVGP